MATILIRILLRRLPLSERDSLLVHKLYANFHPNWTSAYPEPNQHCLICHYLICHPISSQHHDHVIFLKELQNITVGPYHYTNI